MSNKKMTRDEAERAANDWMDKADTVMYVAVHDDNFCVFLSNIVHTIARFPFEPLHPEIGTTCKFWHDGEWAISKLSEIDNKCGYGQPYKDSTGVWHEECEPFELIDPAEHEELKKQNGKLHMEAADMRGQLKATIEDIQPLRVERERLRREVKRLQGEIIDPEEHAKAKEAEAVLAELLPVCKRLIQLHSGQTWARDEAIMHIAKLLG